MKTIAIFTQNLCAGGVQKVVICLANYLKSKFNVVIILCESNKEEFYKFNKIIKIQSIKININEPNIGTYLIDDRIQKLDEILYDLKPNLLISFEDYNNIIALKSKFNCVKIISQRVSYKGNYDNKVHLLTKEFYIKNIKELYKKAKFSICVSKFIKNELKSFGIDARLIYNGVLLKEKSHVKTENFILCLGRLHMQKGGKDLIKAFFLIKDEIKENLIFVGDGDYKKELEEITQNLDLKNRIKFAGFCDPTAYINNCKIAVMPSYYEGFSNSALEIMAGKKAVLAYAYNGADEIFDKSDLIKVGDIKALAKRLKDLLQDNIALKNLQMKQYEEVKKFDIDVTMKEYEKLINEALACVDF